MWAHTSQMINGHRHEKKIAELLDLLHLEQLPCPNISLSYSAETCSLLSFPNDVMISYNNDEMSLYRYRGVSRDKVISTNNIPEICRYIKSFIPNRWLELFRYVKGDDEMTKLFKDIQSTGNHISLFDHKLDYNSMKGEVENVYSITVYNVTSTIFYTPIDGFMHRKCRVSYEEVLEMLSGDKTYLNKRWRNI